VIVAGLALSEVFARLLAKTTLSLYGERRKTVGFFECTAKETLINEPVVHTTDEAGCNFQIDEGI
jgi:hypothetical protein